MDAVRNDPHGRNANNTRRVHVHDCVDFSEPEVGPNVPVPHRRGEAGRQTAGAAASPAGSPETVGQRPVNAGHPLPGMARGAAAYWSRLRAHAACRDQWGTTPNGPPTPCAWGGPSPAAAGRVQGQPAHAGLGRRQRRRARFVRQIRRVDTAGSGRSYPTDPVPAQPGRCSARQRTPAIGQTKTLDTFPADPGSANAFPAKGLGLGLGLQGIAARIQPWGVAHSELQVHGVTGKQETRQNSGSPAIPAGGTPPIQKED